MTKVFVTDRPAVRITLDPTWRPQTWTWATTFGHRGLSPPVIFQGYGYGGYGGGGENPMQRAQRNANQQN